MKREKSRRRKKNYIISSCIVMLIFFAGVLIMKSADWVQNEWNNVNFATIVFQMHTPLKGTNEEVVLNYIRACLIPACKVSVIMTLVYYFFRVVAERLCFVFDFSLFSFKWQWRWNEKVCKWIARIYFVSLIAVFSVMIYEDAKTLEVFEYIKAINTKSTIFEEEYVDPEEVSLRFPEEKRNLILLYIESMETTYASTDVGGGKPVNYIPELTELAEKYVSFSDSEKLGGAHVSYGSGWTVGALVGTSTGVPFKSNVEGNSMSEYEEFLPGIPTLGEILEQEGYKNYFLCGSDAAFGGRDIFYKKHGNYELRDYYYAMEQKYIPEGYWVNWGYEDQILFEIAKKELDELGKSGETFNYTMLTVDTHHPDGYICELCENTYEQKYANVIACSSKQVADFVAWVQEQSWYENTTLVLLGDHTSMAADFWDDIGDYKRRTYNCFINVPEEVKNGADTKNEQFTTLDFFPTILASLGVDIEGNRLGLGTNLFSDKQTLPEEMGWKNFNSEISYYSSYYVENFEKMKNE